MQLTISKIKDGTVIDHINSGMALMVLRILGISSGTKEPVSMAMNVPSKKMGKKDIVKVEGKFINEDELNRIALIAPGATINLIENYEIRKKFRVVLPEFVEGIIKCPNSNCISNAGREPIKSKFHVSRDGEAIVARCHYCGRKLRNVEDFIA